MAANPNVLACCKNCAFGLGAVLHPRDHRCTRLDGYPHIDDVRAPTGLCGPDALLFQPRAQIPTPEPPPIELQHPIAPRAPHERYVAA